MTRPSIPFSALQAGRAATAATKAGEPVGPPIAAATAPLRAVRKMAPKPLKSPGRARNCAGLARRRSARRRPVDAAADKGKARLIPAGCAHGLLTLEDATDALDQIGRLYVPGHARGLRYDDPAIGVAWPAAPRVIAPADLAWPPLAD